MSNYTIRLYELDLDVHYNMCGEDEIEILDVIIDSTDISLMMLLNDEHLKEIENELTDCLIADNMEPSDIQLLNAGF